MLWGIENVHSLITHFGNNLFVLTLFKKVPLSTRFSILQAFDDCYVIFFQGGLFLLLYVENNVVSVGWKRSQLLSAPKKSAHINIFAIYISEPKTSLFMSLVEVRLIAIISLVVLDEWIKNNVNHMFSFYNMILISKSNLCKIDYRGRGLLLNICFKNGQIYLIALIMLESFKFQKKIHFFSLFYIRQKL